MDLAERLANKNKRPLKDEQLPEVKRLMEKGANRKALTIIFGCSYQELKRAKVFNG